MSKYEPLWVHIAALDGAARRFAAVAVSSDGWRGDSVSGLIRLNWWM